MGLGINVPQVGPYFYNELKIQNPGVIFLSVQLMAPIGALFFGFLSDKTLSIRPYIVIETFFAGFFTILISFFHDKIPYKTEIIAIVWGTYGFFLGGILPLMNVSYMQSGLSPNDFGRTRLFGTLGFLLVNLILIPFHFSREFILFGAGILFFIAIIPVYYLPKGRVLLEKAEKTKVRFSDMVHLLKKPTFILFLIIMFMFYFQFSPAEYIISEYIDHFTFSSIFSEIHVETLPMVWLMGTSVEIGFFFISPYILKKWGLYITIGISFIAGFIRHASLGFFPLGLEIIIMQFLHGIHFSPAYLGSILFMEKNISPHLLATGQALVLITSRGLGAGFGGLFLGDLAGENLFIHVFWISAIVALIGLFLISFLAGSIKKYPIQ